MLFSKDNSKDYYLSTEMRATRQRNDTLKVL